MQLIQLKDNPKVAELVRAVAPKVRKAYVMRPTDKVSLSGTYWDEGSRSTYHVIDLDTKWAITLGHHSPPWFGGPDKDPVQTIGPRQAVICTGVFCGKKATPMVYLHPDTTL